MFSYKNYIGKESNVMTFQEQNILDQGLTSHVQTIFIDFISGTDVDVSTVKDDKEHWL